MKHTLTQMKKANRYYPHRELRKFWRIVFIVIIGMLFYFNSMAQTEDSYLRISYLGNSNNSYKVQIKNLQHCDADISVQCKTATQTQTVTIHIPNNATTIYTLPGGPYVEIKLKALTVCNWAGQMPIWLVLDNRALPVTIKDIRINVIKN